jgi:hypothetical protein
MMVSNRYIFRVKMAAKRHEYLVGFLEESKAETDGIILHKQCKS